MRPEDVVLAPELAEYRDRSPIKQTRAREGIDGSEMELNIVSCLVRLGFTDQEILDYFDYHELPRHSEEKRKSGKPSWLLSLIGTARESEDDYAQSGSVAGHRGTASSPTHITSIRVVESEHNPGSQSYGSLFLAHRALVLISAAEDRGPLTLTRWREGIIAVSEGLTEKRVSVSTARRLGDDLIESGYVETLPIDGRSIAVRLTEKGRRKVPLVRGKWTPMVILTSRLKPTMEAVPVESEEPERSEPKRKTRTKKPNTISAPTPPKLETYRRKSMINDVYRLRFPGRKKYYLQLLTPIEQIAEVWVFQQLHVGYDETGSSLYETFGYPESPEAGDPFVQAQPERWTARRKYLALGALLDAKDCHQIATHHDPDGVLRPSIGLVLEPAYTFFRPMLNAEGIMLVRGTGTGIDRKYSFESFGDPIQVEHQFDFEAFLEHLVNPERRKSLLARLPRGWFHMPNERKRLVLDLLAA